MVLTPTTFNGSPVLHKQVNKNNSVICAQICITLVITTNTAIFRLVFTIFVGQGTTADD